VERHKTALLGRTRRWAAPRRVGRDVATHGHLTGTIRLAGQKRPSANITPLKTEKMNTIGLTRGIKKKTNKIKKFHKI